MKNNIFNEDKEILISEAENYINLRNKEEINHSDFDSFLRNIQFNCIQILSVIVGTSLPKGYFSDNTYPMPTVLFTYENIIYSLSFSYDTTYYKANIHEEIISMKINKR